MCENVYGRITVNGFLNRYYNNLLYFSSDYFIIIIAFQKCCIGSFKLYQIIQAFVGVFTNIRILRFTIESWIMELIRSKYTSN